MQPVSPIISENATPKCLKIHRSRLAISEKIVAFDVLAGLRAKRSARDISSILEVPNSTMRSWKAQGSSEEPSVELTAFFSTPHGLKFLQKMVTAAMFVIEYGPSGVRGTQAYLHLSGADQFVASSYGALQAYSMRMEQYIVSFGADEEKLRAAKMRARKITAGLDEMFRGRHPCLVAIEVASNFILLEKFTEDRTADTWKRELSTRLDGLNIEIGQVTSDLCGAITSYAKNIGASHSPDLFHGQYELSKATAGPLASQERSFEKSLEEADVKMKKVIKKHGESSEEARRASGMYNLRKHGLEERQKRTEKVRAAKRTFGEIYHPIDMQSGKLQTAEGVKKKMDEQIQTIEGAAIEAGFSQGCMDRIAKAGRAFAAMVVFLTTYLAMLGLSVDGLQLARDQKEFFLNVVFPLTYLKLSLKRQSKIGKEKLKQLLENLEEKMKTAPWPNELKEAWIKHAKELAELFQRSSSCVEGRNGMLSLLHHRCHRLNAGRLKALTVVHNYHIRRADGSTAAERFFEQKHGSLFSSIVENVRIPGRPHCKAHVLTKTKEVA
jgi:uncharacterized protein DUF6399